MGEQDEVFEEELPEQFAPEPNAGILPPQAVEKLFTLEMSDPDIKEGLERIWKRVGWKDMPFATLRPTREFFLGRNDPFDEYIITSDFESSISLALLHPALQGYATILYMFAIAKAALTRSRGGFQQINLRSYYGHQFTEGSEPRKRGWGIPPMKGSRK